MSEPEVYRQELAPGLVLVRTRRPDDVTFTVENSSPHASTVTLDITQSSNMNFKRGGLVRECEVPSGDSKVLGIVVPVATNLSWSLKYQLSYTVVKEVPVASNEAKPASSYGQHDSDNTQQPSVKSRDQDHTSFPAPERHEKPPTSEDDEVVSKELEQGVVVYRRRKASQNLFTFDCTNLTTNSYTLTIDLSQSENFAFTDGYKKKEVIVDPHTDIFVGESAPIDLRSASRLHVSFILEGRKYPSDEFVAKHKPEDERHVEQAVAAYIRCPLFQGDDGLRIPDLIESCKKYGVVFIDTEFLPEHRSIFTANSEHYDPTKPITWRRAPDFLDREKMAIFADSIEPMDIKQGLLGNCWLMCALAALAEFPKRVRKLFESRSPQTANEPGAYQVCVYKNGEPRCIRLDDFFPCFPGAGPMFSRAHGPELWVLLLEKAFAKLCGCYDMLRGGYAYEALMDLTGCPTETYTLAEENQDKMFQLIVENDRRNNVMCASVPGEDKWSATNHRVASVDGLVSGHAYAAISAIQTSQGHRLIQFRNPWGDVEWKGPWGDGSKEWTQQVIDEVKPIFDKNDGLFYMSIDDVFRRFKRFNICYVRSKRGIEWQQARAKGIFRFGDRAVSDRVSAHAFRLSVEEDTEAWLSIHQSDMRQLFGKHYADIGLVLYKVNGGDLKDLTYIDGTTCRTSREVQLHLPSLEAGDYLVVPITSGLQRPGGRCGERDDPKSIPTFEERGGVRMLSGQYMSVVNEIFRRYDWDMDGFLDGEELADFYAHATGIEKSEFDVSMLQGFDWRREKGLTRDGFVSFFQSKDESTIDDMFERLGYERLMLATERMFVLTCHSECHVTWKRLADGFKRGQRAFVDLVEHKGKVQHGDQCDILQLIHENTGDSIALRNRADFDIEATVDCTKSINVASHRGSLKHTQVVPAGSTKLFHHIQPIRLDQDWTVHVSLRWHEYTE